MNTLTQLLADLVAIDSVNPDLVPGGAGENAIAHFMADWLRNAHLAVHLDEVLPNRPNVIAIARGTGGGKTLLLNGHTDTVTVAGMATPHQPRIKANRMYGRGAYDMKCGIAACMVAIAKAKKLNLRGDVIFTGVMDEEYAGLGTMDVAKKYSAAAAIVAEPTEMQLVTAHKGFVWFDVETHGIAAHGSRPDLGIDAISKMGAVLVELDTLNTQLLNHSSPHPLLGTGSLHGSLITGGQELSSYPEKCLLQIERRTLPGETPKIAEAQITHILQRMAAQDPHFKFTLRRGVNRAPMETAKTSLIASLIKQHAQAITQQPTKIVGAPYWTDAATLAQAGTPAVLFGPSGAGAHAIEEWVDLDSVHQCTEIYLSIIKEFCQ
jgi:acetylornithine deacetylase